MGQIMGQHNQIYAMKKPEDVATLRFDIFSMNGGWP